MNIYRVFGCVISVIIIVSGVVCSSYAQVNKSIVPLFDLLLQKNASENEDPTVRSISISGPDAVNQNSGAQYTCTALYSDGSTSDASSDAQWKENSAYASLNSSGYLTVISVPSDQTVTITCEYGEKSDAYTVTILKDPPVALSNRCEGFSGTLELQVLVGPSEAVGLEPVAVGSLSFATTCSDGLCSVHGSGSIDYEATYTAEWGTYSVTMDMNVLISGECSGECNAEALDLLVELEGEQLVIVDSAYFYGEYPWSGTQVRVVSFPFEEGATAEGEGWAMVLHLGQYQPCN